MSRTKEEPFKVFNIRYVPLFVIFLILGIFTVRCSYLVAIILWTVAAVLAFLLFYTKSVKYGVAIALIVTLFAGYGWARLELHLRNDVGLTGGAEVTCRVVKVTASEGDEEEDVTYIVMADGIRSGGKSYGGKITFKTQGEIAVGDRVTLTGEVAIQPLSLQNVYTALQYRTGAKYTVELSSLSKESGKPPLSYKIKKKVFSTLIRFQGERAGGFSYAMLFGDAENMASEDKEAMREVGVAHVFAVSGLHVGVLSAAIFFLLRKLKLKDKTILFVIFPIFGFYAYLAGFAPSVLRASVMVMLGLSASAIGERYDDLSALFFTAGLLLLCKPLYLFDISFIMSFLSILGIVSLARPLESAFKRKRMKPWLASGLALSISVTVALVPVSAVVFGNISLVGFLLNLIVVPLASLAYILMLAFLLLTLITPAFGVLLETISFLPLLIMEISGDVAARGLSTTYDFSVAEILLYYAVIAFVGKYSLARKKVKYVVGGMGAGIMTLLVILL